MTTVIMQKWDGITPGQYDALRETVGWDRDVPAGMRFHVTSFGDGILRMTDVGDSEELFGTFVQTRILPGLRQLGISRSARHDHPGRARGHRRRRHLTRKAAAATPASGEALASTVARARVEPKYSALLGLV